MSSGRKIKVGDIVWGGGYDPTGMTEEQEDVALYRIFEVMGLSNVLGEAFAHLHPIDWDSDTQDVRIRVSEIQKEWAIVDCRTSPSQFKVGFEYRVPAIEDSKREYFRVLEKTPDGMLVEFFGRGGTFSDFWDWEEVCLRYCTEENPHPV